MALIERFTRAQPYPTRFSDAGHSLVQSMKLVVAPAARLNAADTIQLAQLVMLARRMHQAGIVHGGLHPKSLLWDSSRVAIIDFEPSLRQLKGYHPCLMGTTPFIHPLDVRAGRLSRQTDWMYPIHLARGPNASACTRLASEADRPHEYIDLIERRTELIDGCKGRNDKPAFMRACSLALQQAGGHDPERTVRARSRAQTASGVMMMRFPPPRFQATS